VMARLGLAGDVESVRGIVRRLVRKPPATLDPSVRDELLALLAPEAAGSSLLRGSGSDVPPRDAESHIPLVRVEPGADARPRLNTTEQADLDRFVIERQAAHRLAAAGLRPPRSLLMIGPPGVGKTMTARYLAGALDRPLVTMDLAGSISSLLGKTGQNLRQALDFARERTCVLFLDEFDALAKRRDDDTDVGELKRIVNVLLLELERWPDSGLLVAATNHPELLDRAAERRFDTVIRLRYPDVATRRAIVSDAIQDLGLELDEDYRTLLAEVTEGATGSDLVRLIEAGARHAVVTAEPLEIAVIGALLPGLRAAGNDEGRAAFVELAVSRVGMSHRQVAKLLEVSHPTVGKLLRSRREGENDVRRGTAAAGGRRSPQPAG
jgi:SpoVK/Ycf46/Vps4 family AAA+-type ATPase